jgi:peptide/nickel transport system permease protein
MDVRESLSLSSEELRESYVIRNLTKGISNLFKDRLTKLAVLYILFVLLLGLFGPMLSPYEYDAQQFSEDGTLDRLESPNSEHLLGTTQRGEDVLSRILYGARPTVITGLLGGFMMVGIGMSIGVTAGYLGGTTEAVLMRFTDFVYGVPLIPFALVLISFVGVSFIGSIFVIGLILWRGNARVMRSQVLQIKNRSYIQSARAVGASPSHIIFKHILPNLTGMAVLFFSIGIGIAIIYQANLAFLGVSNPFLPSWGIMVRNAYNSGYMTIAWWWSMIPGFMISLTVLSTFLIGRGYETDSSDQIGVM